MPCLFWVKLRCAGAHILDGVVRPRLVLPSQSAQYVASSQQLRHVRRCAVLHSLGAFYGRRWQMLFFAAGFALSSWLCESGVRANLLQSKVSRDMET